MSGCLGNCLGSYAGTYAGTRAANMSDEDRKGAGICCCLTALVVVGMMSESKGETLESQSIPMRIVEHYHKNISPKLHEELNTDRICKFTPSCSTYAKEAIEKYGDLKGSALAASRLIRCNPLSKGGYDPVK